MPIACGSGTPWFLDAQTNREGPTMPATIITREALEPGIEAEELKQLVRLRLLAGAIRCWREGQVLLTEWNVFGANDDDAEV